MSDTSNVPSLEDWFEAQNLQNVTQLTKESLETSAWFASAGGQELFLKLYPHEFTATHAAIEIAISGANLHPAIVPLRQTVPCREGTLLLYDRVQGENLGPMAARSRFHALPLSERSATVSAVMAALATIGDAGFMIVDWYEGNMRRRKLSRNRHSIFINAPVKAA